MFSCDKIKFMAVALASLKIVLVSAVEEHLLLAP